MLQRLIYMDACISNNFIFIFFIIIKNYCKVKRPETEVAESIQKVYLSEIATLCSTFLSGAKLPLFVLWIASEQYGHKAYPQQRHLFAKCEHGLKYNFRIV